MGINNFIYFMHNYHDVLNGGGTFTLPELVRVFLDSEPNSIKESLLQEIEIIHANLQLEDWEMEKEVRKLCDQYGKKRLKRIVALVQKEFQT